MSLAHDSVIFCFGANHRSASIDLREKLHANDTAILERLPRIKQEFGFSELASLSTCNRFEIFGVGPKSLADEPAFSETLHRAMVAFDMLDHNAAARLREAAYALTGRDAVRHLFAVASSLDSLVVGETQITGQFKQALATAQEARTLGPLLNRLGQDALSASKKIRSQTAIGRGCVSIGNAAVELAGKIFDDSGRRHFCVVGAGEMGAVTARCLAGQKPRELTILNRGLDRARDLAITITNIPVKAAGIENLDQALIDADVLIVTTAAPHPVIQRNMVQTALKRRRSTPLVLIDIALPRNIDPGCSALDDVYLFDIDDLKQVVDENRAGRAKAAEDAGRIIDDSVTAYERWLAHMTVAPALQKFNDHLTSLFHREAEKTLAGQSFHLEQAAEVRALLNVLASRLTADAGRGLRQLVDEGSGKDGARLLGRIFPGEPGEKP